MNSEQIGIYLTLKDSEIEEGILDDVISEAYV